MPSQDRVNWSMSSLIIDPGHNVDEYQQPRQARADQGCHPVEHGLRGVDCPGVSIPLALLLGDHAEEEVGQSKPEQGRDGHLGEGEPLSY